MAAQRETAPAAPGHPRMVPLSGIVEDSRVWPRIELDAERVKLFAELYANEPDVLPAIELAPIKYTGQPAPKYVIVDGWHRFAARKRMHAANVPAIIREDLRTLDDIYIEACRRSGTSSKPLSSREKRAAVRRILKAQPKLSDREIARIVGVSHPTVAKMRNPLGGFLSRAGDALTSDGTEPTRSGPRSIEARALILFTGPKAEAPDVGTLTSLFRNDRAARAAARKWVVAIAAAYDATAQTPASPGASTSTR